MMKCTVLCDNNTLIDQYYLGEPALSLYIEDEEDRILFDTGYSDVFIKNAEKLGIDLSSVNKIVFSHGHNDHTGGLTEFIKRFSLDEVMIIAHPDVFKPRILNNENIGSLITEKELIDAGAELILTKKAIKISKNITFLGEIGAECKLEFRYSIGTINGEDDYMMDDTALACECDDGLFILTGCSHSGICNIMETACKTLKKSNIKGVLGGFHLFEVDERLNLTINYFQEKQIEKIYPCHCVSLAAKTEMAKKLKIQEIGSGITIEI